MTSTELLNIVLLSVVIFQCYIIVWAVTTAHRLIDRNARSITRMEKLISESHKLNAMTMRNINEPG